MKYLFKISRWIETEYDDCISGLPLFRIFYAWIGLIGTPSFLWLIGMPDSFFFPPPGVPMFFSGFPGPVFFYLFEATNIFLWVMLLFGAYTFPVSILLGIIQILGNGFAFSFGKIDHSILGILVLFAGAFAGWGHRFSVDASVRQKSGTTSSWPLSIFAVAISFTMLTAALPKIETGWLALDTQSVLGHMVHNYYVLDRETWLGRIMLEIDSRWFWEAQDWATVMFEAGFIFFVWNLRSFRFFCCLAVFSHLGVYFSMNIFFGSNLLAYALFVPWNEIVPKAIPGKTKLLSKEADSHSSGKYKILSAIYVAAAVCTVVIIFFGNPITALIDLMIATPILLRSFMIFTSAFVVIWSSLSLIGFLPMNKNISINSPLILFDGVCGLCNKWVDFVLKIDRKGVVKFASLQSKTGTDLVRQYGLKEGYLDSVVLIDRGKVYTKSDAVLELMRQTKTIWSAVNVFSVLPRFFRDAVYDLIAANRYRFFGKHDSCRLPSPEERSRFLDV